LGVLLAGFDTELWLTLLAKEGDKKLTTTTFIVFFPTFHRSMKYG
jgi:hypothetical protein